MAGAVGRPRKNPTKRRGNTARDEILDAAAELFTTRGFATTSTHQIAEAVGIRQASLYYHFPSKSDIFMALLASTVDPALELAGTLAESQAIPEQKLWSLVAAETRLLLTPRWNLGRLYQLPMASSDEFTAFHAARMTLHGHFRSLSAALVGAADPRVDLAFYLAQSATEMRPNDGTSPFTGPGLPPEAVTLADAALKILDAELPPGRIDATLELIGVPSPPGLFEEPRGSVPPSRP